MTEKRFQYIRGKYSHGVHDTVKDGEYKKGYRTTYDEFDLDKLTDELNIRENRINQLEKENEQLYELIDFANTLIAFKTSESCQVEWAKRLKELKGE